MIRPMLGVNADLDKLQFPVYVSPKMDGVRAIINNGKVYSRNGKLIPNMHTQDMFGRKEYNGLDGELIVGSVTAKDVFRQTTSGVMSIRGQPDVWFCAFDLWDMKVGFTDRWAQVQKYRDDEGHLLIVPQTLCYDIDQLESYEQPYLSQGFEGIMMRYPNSLYKNGRSTVKEGALLKLKRFTDGEAVIISYSPLMRNMNEAKTNELGYTERSSAQDGKVAVELLGTITVRDLETNLEFNIGSGFNDQMRDELWRNKHQLIGKIVKYKHFEVGAKDKPRFPIFLGFRNKIDL